MTGRLFVALLLGSLAVGPALAGTPLDPGGDDTGFVPTGPSALLCERFVHKNAVVASRCVMRCHFKAVSAVFRGLPFDEGGCEDTAATSCSAKYDATLAHLPAGICPPCLDSPSKQQTLYPLFESVAESVSGRVYCATGGAPIGDGGDGFVPTQADVFKCEEKLEGVVSKLVKCIGLRCHRDFVNLVFQGRPFNEEACEESEPVHSCKARFDAATAKLSACPPCVTQNLTQSPTIFDTVKQALDANLGAAYCGSPSGAFVE